MKVFRLSTGLYLGLSFALVACQPVTRRPEMPTLIEHKIPTHAAHAGGIMVGADGALWFAETGANQIGRISMDGVVTEYPIPTEDALDDTQGFVGLGPDGAIWFNEDRVNKLGRITPDGTITEVDLPQGTAPIRQIVAGTDGALWVTAIDANKIAKLSTEGKVLAEYTLPNPDSVPVGMVVGPDGAFWFVENGANQIGRITTDGEITEYAIPTANSVPLRLTVGPDNALWFTMARANKIGRISVEGNITEYDVSGMLPVGIAAGADGALWFTGYQSTEIGRLTTDGVLTKLSIPTYAAVPYHIVAGPDGNLWFTEQQGNQIGQIKLPVATTAKQESDGAPKASLSNTFKQPFECEHFLMLCAPPTFSSKIFDLPMSVSFGSGWQVTDDLPDLVTIENSQVGSGLSFYIVTNGQLADFVDGHLIPFPADFLSWVKSDPDLAAVESTLVTVGGIKGVQIDVTPIWKSTTETRKRFLSVPDMNWNMVPSPEQWRFILLDNVKGERVLILLSASVDKFQSAIPEAQKILDTVVFSKPTTFSPKLVKTPMSVSFGADWHVDYDLPAKFGIGNQDDFGLAFYIVTNAQLADPLDGHLMPFPEDFVAWIKSNPDFAAVTAAPVAVAGIVGVQIDATPIWKSTTARLKLFLSLSGDPLGNMHGQPDGENIVNDPEQWRFILLDNVHGERVLIMLIDGNGHKFEDAVEHSQKVLDTVMFTKP